MRTLIRNGLEGWSQEELAAAEWLVQKWNAKD